MWKSVFDLWNIEFGINQWFSKLVSRGPHKKVWFNSAFGSRKRRFLTQKSNVIKSEKEIFVEHCFELLFDYVLDHFEI